MEREEEVKANGFSGNDRMLVRQRSSGSVGDGAHIFQASDGGGDESGAAFLEGGYCTLMRPESKRLSKR
jgi:hypothetical protein